MAITFDPTNKYILIDSGTSLTALEIYNAVMEWHDEQASMGYDVPMAAIGKAPLGGGVYTDSIFILQSGWKLKLYDGTYQFRIIGTMITDDGSIRTVQPDSGFVEITFQVTSQGIIIVSGSGVTEQDKQDIANLVWEHTTADTLADRVDLIRKINEGRWKITSNQLIIYDDGGVTVLRTFNLLTKGGVPTEKDVAERVPV